FFTSETKAGREQAVGHHIAPIVLRGKVYYNVGNHRWTFGVQYRNDRPLFKTMHLPDRKTLARVHLRRGGRAVPGPRRPSARTPTFPAARRAADSRPRHLHAAPSRPYSDRRSHEDLSNLDGLVEGQPVLLPPHR